MSTNVYDILKERGFLEQETHAEVRDLLGKEKVTFYIGFDATADSTLFQIRKDFLYA